ncbi:site-specific integrase [Pseudoduganella umbonata]|uniref:Integrase n=1 Tax=Pseudoduganella umbonata TaxID=864828 RepID=A0A4P8HNC8_9BURK|nr:site-specific integrase [Pseudoduganella umbonata]MBB3219900.1 integrase [Pseudoduganella umbonata]QCP09922.1 site-specific integrase [Pseudoduganella umbonata]
MTELDLYLAASTRDNTRQSYQAALRHFEVEWGGLLPASSDSVAHYLAQYGATLSISTLRQRLAALAAWHQEHGFGDPTRNPIVRKVLRGVQAIHPAEQKRAAPLQIEQLAQVDSRLTYLIECTRAAGDRAAALRHLRDRALFLLGFWRGFRSDELSRLRVEHIRVVQGEGMECYLPRTKTDRYLKGQTFRVPQLSRMCPVSAYLDWVQAADLQDGPVFRRVDRWGNLGDDPLNVDSLLPLLRRVLATSEIDAAELYSTHSLRRGFASWAAANGWDLKTLMEHVGWKSAQSALRYIELADPFNQQRIEKSLKDR